MDFELPEELRILKAGLRRFVDNELIPIERQTTDGEALKPEYLERFEQRARDLGIWQLDVPEEYGGGGMPILARAIVWEELSRTIAIPAREDGHAAAAVLLRHIQLPDAELFGALFESLEIFRL